jgi:hypothetical protein
MLMTSQSHDETIYLCFLHLLHLALHCLCGPRQLLANYSFKRKSRNTLKCDFAE